MCYRIAKIISDADNLGVRPEILEGVHSVTEIGGCCAVHESSSNRHLILEKFFLKHTCGTSRFHERPAVSVLVHDHNGVDLDFLAPAATFLRSHLLELG